MHVLCTDSSHVDARALRKETFNPNKADNGRLFLSLPGGFGGFGGCAGWGFLDLHLECHLAHLTQQKHTEMMARGREGKEKQRKVFVRQEEKRETKRQPKERERGRGGEGGSRAIKGGGDRYSLMRPHFS